MEKSEHVVNNSISDEINPNKSIPCQTFGFWSITIGVLLLVFGVLAAIFLGIDDNYSITVICGGGLAISFGLMGRFVHWRSQKG